MDNPIDLKERLVASIEHLEYTVSASKDAISKKFGEDSPLVHRLNNYNTGIENQKVLVKQLGLAIEEENLSEISRLTILINSISLMIKDDARSLLEEMHTGTACEIDKDMLH